MRKSLSLEQQYQALQAQNERLQCLLVQQEKQIAEHNDVVLALQEKERLIQQKERLIDEQIHLVQQKENLIQEQDNLIRSNENALRQKEEIIRIQKIELDYLKERLSILLSKRFKAQSEQLKYLQGQLFDEAELEKAIQETQQAIAALESSDALTPATDAAEPVSAPSSAQHDAPAAEKPKRKKLPESLRRVEVMIDVSAEDKQAMGDDWVEVGFESSEQLAVQQREYYVKVLKRKKYVRKETPKAQTEQATTGIVVAPTANVILPRAIADASLLADVLCSKFVDAMSFYRTEQRLRREGIDIGYSTLCDWPLQLYERLVALRSLFYEALGQRDLWHLDETTLQVLDEPGRDNQLTSYLWGIRAESADGPIVLFHYNARRTYEALEQWLRPCLQDFTGVIVSDEHGAYNTLVKNHPNIKAHGGCLAHCRRKFADASKGRRHDSPAHKVLQKIALIYAQNTKLAHLSGDALVQARRERVKPQMEQLKAHLDTLAPLYLEKGAMKTAIGYALNNWHKFTAFLDHAEMPIDNNPMEQTIRPFTLGRKNWLFSGSPRGADASAFIYSLIESAKANGLEPVRYLNELFERYPHAKHDDQRRLLLPWNFKNIL